MMSLALAVCAVTLFLVIALLGQSLIQPLRLTSRIPASNL